MRRQIVLLMALCLYMTARSQTGYTYDYWFDNDRQTTHSGSSESDSWQLQIDVSDLQETIHAIHLQVQDHEGNQSSAVTRYFIKTNEPSAVGRYWFDDDVQRIYTSAQVQGMMDIDVSQLSEGFHSIHYQVLGKKGNLSSVSTKSFYKVYMPTKSSWRCWFDNDPSTMVSGNAMNETLLLNVEQLSDGYHVIHIQADGGASSQSTPLTKPFVKIPQTIGVDDFTCLCMIDDKLVQQEKVPASGGVIGWNFDVSHLSQGFHHIFIQVVTPSGAASNTWHSFFLRETTLAEFGQMICVYAIDGAEFYTEAGTMADGSYHFDLDVSSLEDGLHRITYMLSNGNGVTTKAQTQFFMKTPLGGNGITEYWYWLNEQDSEQARKVTLPERKDPFSLITLLPVETQPIRSKLFQFKMVQNQPTIYAKNDIHLRFYDASGRFTDVSKQFVDEQVSEEVTDIMPIGPNEQKTVDRPGVNQIKWFVTDALKGDRLDFKTDKACTLQVFSPEGKEIYSANGSAAVAYNGVYAESDGKYYIAMHDVTAQNGNTVTLDYQHMDKYAIQEIDIDEIGIAPSVVPMTIHGNGFDKLKQVYLHFEGDTIWSDFSDLDKATAICMFTLEGGEKIGAYELNLVFDDEDEGTAKLIFPEHIRLGEPVFGELFVDVVTSRTTATPYPVTIKVKNTGNVSRLYTPVTIVYDNPDVVNSVNFENFFVTMGKAAQEGGYNPVLQIDDFAGTGKRAEGTYLFIPTIAPKETKNYTLSFNAQSHANLNLYVATGNSANDIGAAVHGSTGSGAPAENRTIAPSLWDYMNEHTDFGPSTDPLDCLAELDLPKTAKRFVNMAQLARDVADLYVAIGHVIAGIVNGSAYQRDMMVAEGSPEQQKEFHDAYANRFELPSDILNRAGHPFLGAMFALWEWQLLNAKNGERPTPHPIEILNAGDPNDIFGYKAPSGSKAVGKNITEGYYTIEFENDPEIATAAAHTIIVKDTLDKERFNLSSFEPTGIKLGDVHTEISKETKFPLTIDLRPRINVIAQVEHSYDQNKGIATWTITSLDPMTMEQTDDAMQGVLPVNVDGNGQGEITFNINFKDNLTQGTEIHNRAGIVFDRESVIMTPVWVNTIDSIAPLSRITGYTMKNGTEAILQWNGADEGSGIWRYDLYRQTKSDGVWTCIAKELEDTLFTTSLSDDEAYGFCVIATDSAGNVEKKRLLDELSPVKYLPGDANGDDVVNSTDAQMVVNYYLGKEVHLNFAASDMVNDGQLNSVDAQAIQNIYLNSTEGQKLLPKRHKNRLILKKQKQ